MGATAALLALTAANTGTQVLAQRRAATGAEAQGNYEGAVADQNAGLADAQATDALARGAQAESRHRGGVRQLVGSQRAALAASGVDIGTGSAADVQADAASLGEFDALTIRNNARREAYGFQVDAANARARGAMARTAGRTTAASLRNQGWGTLLTGALETYGLGKGAGVWGGAGGKPKGGGLIASRGWGG